MRLVPEFVAPRDAVALFPARFECKYLIDPLLVPEIRDFVRVFAPPDPFAALVEDHRYEICSLYLDTQDLALYRQTVCGEKNRFKLRLRTYTDDAGAPVFLEVKRRMNGIVHKRRVRLSRDQLTRFVRTGTNGWAAGISAATLDELETFSGHVRLAEARPVLKVRYLREAYEAPGGDRVRITFDTDLKHAVTFNYEILHRDPRWETTPVDGTILEIKFTEHFPSWVRDLVREFDLRQQSIPKYVLSLDRLADEGTASALALAGFSIPPRRW